MRPTSDRVREAIFSALGPIDGARVLDLYCGTGALAIEAISRGAANAVLVDRDIRPSLGNVEHLGLADRCRLVRAFIPEGIDPESLGGPFDLIFCDPPYRLADRIDENLDKLVPTLLAPAGRVIVESAASRPLELPSLQRQRDRRYGGTQVAFYKA